MIGMLDPGTEGYAVEIRGLTKTFDGKDFILNGVDIGIPRGKICVIIGFSGTGKSVLLKHILGLLSPTAGEVKVLGEDLSKLDSTQLARHRTRYGMLFQYAALFDDLTAVENVEFPIKEHRREMPKLEREAIAEAKLRQSGLDSKHFRKLPSEMSGGMRKRVGLARALALDPEILVYDEPTTGLDPILTEMVDNLIVNTHRSRPGTTSIIVSHDLYGAFRIADCMAMLDSGRVLLAGTPDDFLKSDVDLVKRFVSKGMHRQEPEAGSQ